MLRVDDTSGFSRFLAVHSEGLTVEWSRSKPGKTFVRNPLTTEFYGNSFLVEVIALHEIVEYFREELTMTHNSQPTKDLCILVSAVSGERFLHSGLLTVSTLEKTFLVRCAVFLVYAPTGEGT